MQQARVIKLSGIGPEALRGAIESGLVAGDVRAACERTVAENDRLRRELAVQRKVNTKQSAVIREYRAERLAVYDTDTDKIVVLCACPGKLRFERLHVHRLGEKLQAAVCNPRSRTVRCGRKAN